MNSYEKPVKPLKIIKVLEDKTDSHESARKIKMLVRDACDNIFCVQYDIQKDSWANTCPITEVFVHYCPIDNVDIGNTYDFEPMLFLDDFGVDGMDVFDRFYKLDENLIDWCDYFAKCPMMNNFNMVDLHNHSKYSDGTDYDFQLIDNLKERGVTIFSVTDHDTVEFYKNLSVHEYFKLNGMRLIPGIEFSCKTELGKCHILGYGIDVDDVILTNTIMMTSALRNKKMINRLQFLEKEYGIIFDEKNKEYLARQESVGKPHIARILVDKGLAANINDAIEKYLSNIPHDEDDRIDAKMAIDAIIHAGGIPVWAHPLGGEGEKRLSEENLCTQMQCLLDKGIKGIEFYYSRYSLEDRKIIKSAMFKTNCVGTLLLSGGSDYHGNVKNIKLGELSSDDKYILGNSLSILTKLPFEDHRHEACDFEDTKFLCHGIVVGLGRKINSLLYDDDPGKQTNNRCKFLCGIFRKSNLFCERKFDEANTETTWFYSENGMIGFSVYGGSVLKTMATRLTDVFIDDIISAFEETLGYRPKYKTQNIMNVVQTITFVDE